MTKLLINSFIVLLIVITSGCGSTQTPRDFTAFNSLNPRSILVVPVVNESLEVSASNSMLSTLSIPIAESGYYVYPVNTVKVILEQEGFYEPEQIHAQPPSVLAKLFGADAVLFVTIKRWDAQYIVVSTTVTIGVEYALFSKDNSEIWRATSKQAYETDTLDSNKNSLLGAIVSAAIERATPDYMRLARKANRMAILTGKNPIPKGPLASEVE